MGTMMEFRRRFADRLTSVDRTQFPGVNLMTPEVLGYVLADDGNPVEVSLGSGFDHEPIYGVTWPRPRLHEHDRSQLCHSMDEVEEVIGANPRGSEGHGG